MAAGCERRQLVKRRWQRGCGGGRSGGLGRVRGPSAAAEGRDAGGRVGAANEVEDGGGGAARGVDLVY